MRKKILFIVLLFLITISIIHYIIKPNNYEHFNNNYIKNKVQLTELAENPFIVSCNNRLMLFCLGMTNIYFPLSLYTNTNFVYDIYYLLNNKLEGFFINIYTLHILIYNYELFNKIIKEPVYNIDNRYQKIINYFDNSKLVKQKIKKIRFVMNYWDSFLLCITNIKSNITNWEDLKGKKILLSIESSYSSDYYIGKLILKSANLNENDYTIVPTKKNISDILLSFYKQDIDCIFIYCNNSYLPLIKELDIIGYNLLKINPKNKQFINNLKINLPYIDFKNVIINYYNKIIRYYTILFHHVIMSTNLISNKKIKQFKIINNIMYDNWDHYINQFSMKDIIFCNDYSITDNIEKKKEYKLSNFSHLFIKQFFKWKFKNTEIDNDIIIKKQKIKLNNMEINEYNKLLKNYFMIYYNSEPEFKQRKKNNIYIITVTDKNKKFKIGKNANFQKAKQLAIKNTILFFLKKNPTKMKKIISNYLLDSKNKYANFFNNEIYFKKIKEYFNYDLTDYDYLAFKGIIFHEGIVSFYKDKNLIQIV